MSKPDWKYAPKWAKWLAEDSDGCWCWWASEPTPEADGEWYSKDRCEVAKTYFNPKWMETLEERPNE